jgi:Holliday junction DNA helicase RuvB P-loop domain
MAPPGTESIGYDRGVVERRRCEHVIIYGPPGAGKLTVARVLAERYGMRVLDNHLSVDPALRLFDFGTPEFGDLVERIRVALLRAAARAGLDVVSTFVYAHLVDDDHLATLIAASADDGANVTLVQLAPSIEALASRVRAPSRLGTTKISDPDVLRRLLVEYDLRTPARSDDLVIDNTALIADDAAQLIAEHVGLVPSRAADPPGPPAERRATRRGG